MQAPKDLHRTRTLNDVLRQYHIGGRVYVTVGIAALGDQTVAAILNAVSAYDDFTPENDPDGLHDFGILEVEGHAVMFKIDEVGNLVHGVRLTAQAPDRVLTVMLGNEW